MNSLLLVLEFSLVFWGYQLHPINYAAAQCQIDDPFLERLGQTRFFILHNKTKRGDYSNWEDSVVGCEAAGMKLAKVDSIGTDVMVGRYLEQLTKKNNWKDTWYWINAKFDPIKEQYVWQDEEQQTLKYTNFFYRQPRPTGVAAFITWYGSYDRKKQVEQCIAIALPWPMDDNYGYQTSWDEKPCDSVKKRHALCEAESECDEEGIDPKQTFTEGSESYVYDGNWIIGDRRFIVNWKPRTYEEANTYCSKYGLELYVPRANDACFIPFAKLWTQRINSYHFWTSLKYKWDKRQFTYANGKVLPKAIASLNFVVDEEQGRSNKMDSEFCVTTVYTYEYPNQTACHSCSWSMMVVAPANCNNNLGTICQHKDAKSRKCMWKKQYQTDATLAYIETATVEFGMTDPSAPKDQGRVFRSTFKQPFGNRHCPPKTKMVRAKDEDWHKIPPKSGLELSSIGISISPDSTDSNFVYAYDYTESYWLVDDDMFDKTGKMCTLSVLEGGKRQNKQVDCNEWHFYVCENITLSQPDPASPPATTATLDAGSSKGTGKRRKRFHHNKKRQL